MILKKESAHLLWYHSPWSWENRNLIHTCVKDSECENLALFFSIKEGPPLWPEQLQTTETLCSLAVESLIVWKPGECLYSGRQQGLHPGPFCFGELVYLYPTH